MMQTSAEMSLTSPEQKFMPAPLIPSQDSGHWVET